MATYYVKTGGNDSAAGTSDGTAWANHPWMSTWTGSVTLTAGDTVCMNRGDTWSISSPVAPYMTVGQSGSEGSPITTTSYGSGNKPIIIIATDSAYTVINILGKSYLTFNDLDIRHFESTQDTGNNQNGIRFGKDASLNVPHDITITNCDIHNIPYVGIFGYDDSYNITIGDITATTCATISNYSNYIYDCGYAGIVLQGRNLSTNISNFNVYYNYINNIDYSTVIARNAYGIIITSAPIGTSQGQSDGWPKYSYVRYNRVSNVPGHSCIDTHGGEYYYATNNYVYNGLYGIVAQTVDNVNYDTATLNYAYIEDNYVENPGDNTLGVCNFIHVLSVSSTLRATNCYIKNNNIFYTTRPASGETTASGIYIYNIDGIDISGNKIYNGPTSAARAGMNLNYSGGTGYLVKNLSIYNNFILDWSPGVHIRTDNVDGNLSFYNNIIYSHGRPIVAENGAFTGDLLFYNNSLLTSDIATLSWVLDFSGAVTISAGASLKIKNNILGCSSTSTLGTYILAPGTITGTFESDYNLFWNSSDSSPFYYGGGYRSWSYWTTTLSLDTHSPNYSHGDADYNPVFNNISGVYNLDGDFRLQSSSPCINAGTDVDVDVDYANNTRVGNPDIGAFEYITDFGFSAGLIKF